MRTFGLVVAIAALMGAILFIAAPLYAVLDIGRALRAGDVATLERRVDWPRVRVGLKASLADVERDKRNTENELPRPSLWSRIKMATAPSRFADQMIDRFVTPAGIVQLVRSRGVMRGLWPDARGAGRGDTQSFTPVALTFADLPLHTRLWQVWSRLSRVTLRDHETLDVEVRDARGRRFVGTLERDALMWRLVSVRLLGE